jgi:hypothetical protein
MPACFHKSQERRLQGSDYYTWTTRKISYCYNNCKLKEAKRLRLALNNYTLPFQLSKLF